MATLDGALAHVTALKQMGKAPKDGVTIWMRGGVYVLKQPITISTSPASLTITAYKHEAVTLQGGQTVSGWQRFTDPKILERLDPAARAHVLVCDLRAQGITDFGQLSRRGFVGRSAPTPIELFYDDRPMTLARWPNNGQWASIAVVPNGQNGGVFSYTGERPARWANDPDIWVHGYWSYDWADSYEKVDQIDTQKHEIFTAPPHGVFGYSPGHRWYALNILEELDQAGEWYLDRNSGRLYFWPPSDIRKGRAVVSISAGLIRLDHVSNVTLRGLTLQDCREDAVLITGGANDRLVGCTVRNSGRGGVVLTDSIASGLSRCDISETGDGAITLTSGDRKTLAPGRCFVADCVLHDYARWSRTYTPAVNLYGVGNTISHNLIYNAPHEAIQLSGNDNIVEFNEIHHVCTETGDAGAFYMGRDWTMRGNVVRYNYFHDIGGAPGLSGYKDAMAVYLDDMASGTTVYGNVFVRAGHAVQVGGGRDNTVANNIFVDCRPAVSVDARGLTWAAHFIKPGGGWEIQEKLDAVQFDKPPYSTRYPELASVLTDHPGAPLNNRIDHNIAVRCPDWLKIDSDVGAAGAPHVGNLVNIDPKFVNPAAADYRLKPSSPAHAYGFRRIPFEQIGPRKE